MKTKMHLMSNASAVIKQGETNILLTFETSCVTSYQKVPQGSVKQKSYLDIITMKTSLVG